MMKSIWCKKPAEKWEDAFPVGNGRLGAKIFGNCGHEKIYLNEESIWSGIYTNRNNKASSGELKNIRHLIELSRYDEAQELVYESFTGLPENQSFYESAGCLELDFYTPENYGLKGPSSVRENSFQSITNYRRELDLDSAICSNTFSTEISANNDSEFSNSNKCSVTYTREIFASALADVLVIRISSSVPKSICVRAKLNRKNVSKKYSLSDDTLVMQCIDGIPFTVMTTAITDSGKIIIRGDNLIVERADEVLFFVDVESAFRNNHYKRLGGNVFKRAISYAKWSADLALKKICFASSAQYQNLKKEHIENYQQIKKKQKFLLDTENPDKEEQNLCLEELLSEPKNENKFTEIYWEFCKYVYISSCENPGTLPTLEKGLWYNGEEDVCERKYNLNPNQIYLPGSMIGQEKFDESLLKFFKQTLSHGRASAETIYGTIGYAAHIKMDIWGDTAPDGSDLRNSYNVIGGAVIQKFLGEFFEYNQDVKNLKKYRRFFKEICEFYASNLLLVDDKKNLVLNPSFCDGIKTDNGEEHFICAENLEDNKVIKDAFAFALEMMAALKISESDNLSVQFKSVYDKIKTETLSGENLSESQNQYEYKKPKNLCGKNIKDFVEMSNLIVKSKIVENKVEIYLLPALPEQWKNGSLSGINLKGNILINLSWADGKIKNANVYTQSGKTFIEEIVVCYKNKKYSARLVDGALDLMNVLPTTV